MRFQIDYRDFNDERSKNKSISLLDIFLNYHLLDVFTGWTFECFFITLRNNAPKELKENCKKYLDQYAKVEINGIFTDNWNCNLHDFNQAFLLFKVALSRIDHIPLKEKDYNHAKLISSIEQLETVLPKTEEELIILSLRKLEMENALQIKRVDSYLQASKEHPQKQTIRLIHIRIYDHFGNDALMPYRYMYGEIFSTVLRNEGILTPHYKEIYFGIAETMDAAKRNSPLLIRYWHKYTYSVLDIAKYSHCSEEEKEKMVFKSICEGLRLIADIDHLDKAKVEKTIQHIEKEGVKTVLTYKTQENENYKADVIYTMIPDHTKTIPFYLVLTEKRSGQSKTVFIDNLKTWWTPYSIGKITIKNNEVVIKGNGGQRGEISRSFDVLPNHYKFLISEVFGH